MNLLKINVYLFWDSKVRFGTTWQWNCYFLVSTRREKHQKRFISIFNTIRPLSLSSNFGREIYQTLVIQCTHILQCVLGDWKNALSKKTVTELLGGVGGWGRRRDVSIGREGSRGPVTCTSHSHDTAMPPPPRQLRNVLIHTSDMGGQKLKQYHRIICRRNPDYWSVTIVPQSSNAKVNRWYHLHWHWHWQHLQVANLPCQQILATRWINLQKPSKLRV